MGFPLPYSQFVSDLRYLQLGQAPRLIGDNVVWASLVFDLAQPSPAGKPDFDATEGGLLFPQNDPSEIVYFNVQLPHTWLLNRPVRPVVCYHQTGVDLPVFKVDYRWTEPGQLVAATWDTYTLDVPIFTYTSDTLCQILDSAGTLYPPEAGAGISSVLQIKLYRDDNVVTGDVLAVTFAVHYEVDSMGSETEIYKGWE